MDQAFEGKDRDSGSYSCCSYAGRQKLCPICGKDCVTPDAIPMLLIKARGSYPMLWLSTRPWPRHSCGGRNPDSPNFLWTPAFAGVTGAGRRKSLKSTTLGRDPGVQCRVSRDWIPALAPYSCPELAGMTSGRLAERLLGSPPHLR
jgi:hypothetical protein